MKLVSLIICFCLFEAPITSLITLYKTTPCQNHHAAALSSGAFHLPVWLETCVKCAQCGAELHGNRFEQRNSTCWGVILFCFVVFADSLQIYSLYNVADMQSQSFKLKAEVRFKYIKQEFYN